jgi:hypothetical protein
MRQLEARIAGLADVDIAIAREEMVRWYREVPLGSLPRCPTIPSSGRPDGRHSRQMLGCSARQHYMPYCGTMFEVGDQEER